jgi:multidrug efflux pump subunit AcrB
MVLLSLLLIKVTGITFFPKAEKNQFLVRLTVPDQSDIHYTEEAAAKVEQILDTIDIVSHYATNIGYGNPQIYYNLPVKQAQKNFAEILVLLDDYNVKEFDALVAGLRDTFSRITGARVEIKELEQGSPIEAPFVIKMTGENTGTLMLISQQLEEELRKIQGLVNIDNQINRKSTDLRIVINKDKAAMLGVPVSDIDRTVRAFIAGLPVSVFHAGDGEVYDIVIRAEQGASVAVEDLQTLYVKSQSGRFIPLPQLADISFEPSGGIITHYNLSRSATITADLQKGYFIDDIIENITPWLESYPWPSGYGYHFGGELESRQESFGGMFRALIMASFLIFALLVLQFRSLVQPLIIFSAVPLAVTGGIVALSVTGYPFSFTA